METSILNLEQIKAGREKLGELVRYTPVWLWRGLELERAVGVDTQVFLKLELFQYAGSFKPRGALMVMLGLSDEQLKCGVTAVSAGNHAMAVSYAAKVLKTTAKVVMPKTASPVRVQGCKNYGAEVILAEDIHQAFKIVEEIKNKEGRSPIHPFEGPLTALGTATLGLEFCSQVPDLEAVIVPIGGGGLCAGVSAAVKQLIPSCKIYGVEPKGADSMHRSFVSGKPEAIEKIQTIADSLGAPYALPYSFGLCKQYVDELVLIDDQQIKQGMRILGQEMKLIVEPAGAVATAALIGPLREKLKGKRVGIIICGSNIDIETFNKLSLS